MPSHPLLNFEIERYYRIENRFDNVYSRNNLPEKIKDGAYAVNLDEYAGVGTHWLLYFVTEVRFCFLDSFGVEYIPEEIKIFIRNKIIKANIFRVQANNSIMRRYFCIGFIDFKLAGKKLTDITSLFSPYDLENNEDIILSYFKDELN